MAIPLLNLDDRTFQDMMAEVQALIPRHAPAWTNRNLSDPGVTILELFAWVTEAMLFRIDRVPEASRQRFLELLGAECQPARPALLKLLVTAKVNAGEHLDVPRHTLVSVYPDRLADGIAFETTEQIRFTAELPTRTVVLRQTAPAKASLSSDGQVFLLLQLPAPIALPSAPFPQPPLVWIGDGKDREYWQYVPGLRSSKPGDRHFTIRTKTNAVVFGDGEHGMIPPSGAPIAITYRTSLDPQTMAQRQTLRTSSGAPNQVTRLAATPLPFDLQPASDLAPIVNVAGRQWAYCPNIIDFEPNAPQFTTEPWSNALRFGDGARGRTPKAGATIDVTYRTTVGRVWSLPAATAFVFDSTRNEDLNDLMIVAFSVVDPGAAVMTIDEARQQAFALLKPRWRSITVDDFGAVLMSDQQDVHRVQCLPGDDLAGANQLQPAHIGVLVTPKPRFTLENSAELVGVPQVLDPTGRSLVTSTADGQVWLWNLQTAQQAALAPCAVRSITYSSDGARMVVVEADGCTTLRDGQSGAQLFPSQKLPEPLLTTISLLSPDDTRWFTLTGAECGVAELRAADDGVAFVRLHAPTPVTQAAFTPDGRRLITAHAGGSKNSVKPCVRVWDSVHGGEIATIIQSEAEINRIVTSDNGQAIAAIADDGTVAVWNPAKRSPVTVVRTGAVPKLAIMDPTTTRLVTITEGGAASLWSLQTGELIALLEHSRKVAGAAFGPADWRLVTYDGEGNLRLWDAQSGRHELDLSAGAPLIALVFHRSGQRLAVVTGQPQAVLVWDLAHAATTVLERRNDADTGSQLPMLTFATLSATGEWLAWTETNLAAVWDIAQGRVVATLHHSREGKDLRLAWPVAAGGLILTVMERSTPGGKHRQMQTWNAAYVQEVQQLLAERHLLASELHARGPAYVDVGLRAKLVRSLPPRQDLSDLIAEIERAVLAFFDPLTGGPDKSGWPLGRNIYPSEVYEVMERTPGIDHVESLCLFVASDLAEGAAVPCADSVRIPPHHLVNCVLNANSIQVVDPERLPFAVTG